MKKVITFTIYFLMITFTTSCQEESMTDIKIQANILTIGNKVIDLKSGISKVSNLLNVNFEVENIPGSDAYYSENSNFEFFVNNASGAILSTVYNFYRPDDSEVDEIRLAIDNIVLKSSTNFDEMVSFLTNEKIYFEVVEYSLVKIIKVENHRIMSISYLKNNMNIPARIQFK